MQSTHLILDENDGRLGSTSDDHSSDDTVTSFGLSTTECASPEPAVFGEHESERLVPLQQEAVKSSLIHSVANKTTAPTQLSVEDVVQMTSLASSNKSMPTTKLTLLDFTAQPKVGCLLLSFDFI